MSSTHYQRRMFVRSLVGSVSSRREIGFSRSSSIAMTTCLLYSILYSIAAAVVAAYIFFFPFSSSSLLVCSGLLLMRFILLLSPWMSKPNQTKHTTPFPVIDFYIKMIQSITNERLRKKLALSWKSTASQLPANSLISDFDRMRIGLVWMCGCALDLMNYCRKL